MTGQSEKKRHCALLYQKTEAGFKAKVGFVFFFVGPCPSFFFGFPCLALGALRKSAGPRRREKYGAHTGKRPKRTEDRFLIFAFFFYWPERRQTRSEQGRRQPRL